jgi:hypothetical protein
MTRSSQFHSCGQDGFRDRKEDLVEEIRAWVRKRDGWATMGTLGRMSMRDLSDLRFALQDADDQGKLWKQRVTKPDETRGEVRQHSEVLK